MQLEDSKMQILLPRPPVRPASPLPPPADPPPADPPPGGLASADHREQTHAALLSDDQAPRKGPLWVNSITGGGSQTALVDCPEML